MPTPFRKDLDVYRGDTLTVVLRLWEDVDKTDPFTIAAGMVVTAQARATFDAPAADDFAVSAPVGGNEVTLTMLPAATTNLPPKGVWDCQVDYDGTNTAVQTVVAGTLTRTSDVTRAIP